MTGGYADTWTMTIQGALPLTLIEVKVQTIEDIDLYDRYAQEKAERVPRILAFTALPTTNPILNFFSPKSFTNFAEGQDKTLTLQKLVSWSLDCYIRMI